MFDSLNKRYLPMFGGKDVYAPNFERLAKKSVTFNNSYVASMPCIPARRELHTGRKNFLHREWGPLEPYDNSMPNILKKNGIYSHLISDHIHYWEEGGANYHTKYSTWEIVRGQEGDHWKGSVKDPEIPEVASVPMNQQGTAVSSMWRNDWVNREYMPTEEDQPVTKVFDLGCEFIKKNFSQDNWFLQIETFDPHEPFFVKEHYLSRYEKNYTGKHFDWPRGEVKETPEEIKHVQDVYKALVSMSDANLGKVLDLMDLLNMWEDTMLIVGTDHGFMMSEHGFWGKNQVPYFNEVAKTPLFIYDPRIKNQNESRDALVQMIDWAPTILDFFGLDIPDEMEGKPLFDTLRDDSKVRDEALFGVFSGHVNVTDGEYVYMRAAKPDKINHINNYTLMPVKMHNSFSLEELKKAELVEGFSFTKGLKLLKVPAKDKYGVNKFGTMLFNVLDDPKQLHPISDPIIINRMKKKLIKLMKENEAPVEQYERLGLDEEQ
nr:sulfatase [Streptococcus pacificus]